MSKLPAAGERVRLECVLLRDVVFPASGLAQTRGNGERGRAALLQERGQGQIGGQRKKTDRHAAEENDALVGARGRAAGEGATVRDHPRWGEL